MNSANKYKILDTLLSYQITSQFLLFFFFSLGDYLQELLVFLPK